MTLHENPSNLPANIALSALTRSPFAIVLTNPRIDDNPIVYANKAFEEVTGYAMSAVVGRNCRFLQADDRDQNERDELRAAIRAGKSASVDIRNYTATGTPFRNRLMIAPLVDDDGKVTYFMGIQMRLPGDVAEKAEASEKIRQALSEIQHRVKNHLAMIVSMIRLQANESEKALERDPDGNFNTLARRVETLQLLYEELSGRGKEGANAERIALGAYLARVTNAIAHLDGRRGVRVNVDADAIEVDFEIATRMGLLISELTTNAMQHAFDDRDDGMVEVRIKELSNGTIRIQVSDDGCGLPEGMNWPKEGGLGGRIVRQLVDGLSARLSIDRETVGTIITIDTPDSRESVHA